MSEPRPDLVESRSSIEISRNAKGEIQVRVKVYAGEDAAELQATRELAVETFKQTEETAWTA